MKLITLKLLQERTGKALEHIGIGNDFLHRTPIAQQTRSMIDCIKLNSFCTAKETVTRLNRQLIEWEKIFASYTSDKALTALSRIYTKTQKSKLTKIQQPSE
jgi:hypothetical protein